MGDTGRKVVALHPRPERSPDGVDDVDLVRAFMGSYRFNADGQRAPRASLRRALDALARLATRQEGD